MPWSTPFEDPVFTVDGRAITTLRDAAAYVQKLPAAEQHQGHWQTAVEHLIRAAEAGGGWLFLARIAVLRALNHGRPAPETAPRQKPAKRFRVVS